MSGRPDEFSLTADAEGTIERLFRGLEGLDTSGLRDWTLIGGLAVMVRTTSAHRSTGDIDALARDAEPEGKVVLLAHAGEATSTGVVLADGTKIDVIDVATRLDPEDLPDDSRQRMFILSHWWMADTADDVRFRLLRNSPNGVETIIERPLRLARPAALVAAKLQSTRTRRDARQEKRYSDAYDVYRLLGADSALAIAAELANGPPDLGAWCADYLEELFVEQATRTAQ